MSDRAERRWPEEIWLTEHGPDEIGCGWLTAHDLGRARYADLPHKRYLPTSELDALREERDEAECRPLPEELEHAIRQAQAAEQKLTELVKRAVEELEKLAKWAEAEAIEAAEDAAAPEVGVQARGYCNGLRVAFNRAEGKIHAAQVILRSLQSGEES